MSRSWLPLSPPHNSTIKVLLADAFPDWGNIAWQPFGQPHKTGGDDRTCAAIPKPGLPKAECLGLLDFDTLTNVV